MKAKYILAAGIAISAVMAVVGIYAMIGEKPGGSGSVKKGSIISEKDAAYTTYEAEIGDYHIFFDYPKGLQAGEPLKAMGVVSQDFYSNDMDFITMTVVPAKWNVDDSRPRNAADYAAYRKKNQSGNVISEEIDAQDYRDGEYYGVKYEDVTEYSFGRAYIMGYEIFHGDDYMYIFVQRNDRMPAEIKNLKIRKK